MKQIERISKIKRETLSGENYFQSLLEQAYTARLLSVAELENIQLACLALLAKKTEQLNGGYSSSIQIEKAQSIMASIIFTVGTALKAYPNPDDAVSALQSMGVSAIYENGKKRVCRLLGQAKLCHKSLLKKLLQTKNEFYSSTAADGIKGFFKLYNYEFGAHEIHITADYPVYNKTERLLGIEFIMQYIKQLNYENLFCTYFSEADIHNLLCGFDKHYEKLLFNIYEPVLAAALGCALAGADAKALEITPQTQELLFELFKGKTHTEIEQILSAALAKLAEVNTFSDNLTAYAAQSLNLLAKEIESAVKAGRLEKVFIAPAYH